MEYEILNYITDGAKITEADLAEVNKLYNEAFPEDERIIGTIDDFINKTKSDKRFQLDLFYADPLEKGINQLVGFTYYLVEEDYLYLIFVATKNELRGNGYGKKIINYVKENQAKNKHYFLCAEKLDDKAENKQQRINRQAFFQKLGFSVVETDIDVNGVLFDFYSMNKVTTEEADNYLDRIQEAIIPDYYEH